MPWSAEARLSKGITIPIAPFPPGVHLTQMRWQVAPSTFPPLSAFYIPIQSDRERAWSMNRGTRRPRQAVHQKTRRWLDADVFTAIIADLRQLIRIAG